MINILLDMFNIDTPWLKPALQQYILPTHRVAVVAFAFGDDILTAADWDTMYHPENGKYYHSVVDGLLAYRIPLENIRIINYISDSPAEAADIIKDSDIVYFTGGLTPRLYERILEFGLDKVLADYPGIVMGYSAGALVQLGEYHHSPDKDYPEFMYCAGLGMQQGYYVEVHYEATPIQDTAIDRVLRERQQPVYALQFNSGALIAQGSKVQPIGDVKIFLPEDILCK